MTKTWGPLGWATLHSIAALYPDTPSENEKNLITRWIESFRMCIVCDKCKTHFTTLLNEYKMLYPNWNASRKDLSLFVLRAHNTVNIRQISKPALTPEEAIVQLKANIPAERAASMRQSYIVHIRAEWTRSLNLDGITAARYIRELILTETEYWSKRSFSWNDVEPLIQFESISPLPSREKLKTGIMGGVRLQSAPRIATTGPSTKPRFSFLSR